MQDLTEYPGIPRIRRRLTPHGVDLIVLHFGATRATEAVLAKRGFGTHFIARANGDVACLVRPCDETWHVATGGINHRSIGIDLELVRGTCRERIRGATRLTSPGTREQIVAAAMLVRELCDEWSIPCVWTSPLAKHRESRQVNDLGPWSSGVVAHGAIQANRWDGWTLELGCREFGVTPPWEVLS